MNASAVGEPLWAGLSLRLLGFPALSFVLALLVGLWLIPVLRRLKAGQTVRSEGPQTHLFKSGTPTMGGLIFAVPVVALSLLLLPGDDPGRTAAWVVLAVAAASGLIGLVDDYIKVVLKRPLGLRAREKLFWQCFIGLGLAFVSAHVLGLGTWVQVPFSQWRLELGAVYYPFVLVIVMATGNALNFTDGVDGLLSSTAALTFAFYGVVALARSSPHLAGVAWAIAGACVGFLFFNRHPARVFMGDVGSFFLGGGLAALAVLTRTELLLPVAGGLYAVEVISVILQVASFHLLGRRILRMAPLHHHFELSGWPETAVVQRFWIATAVCSAVAWLGFQSMR